MSPLPNRSIFWFRRDLRLSDNPALLTALSESREIIPLFVIDSAIADRAGEFRKAYLAQSLKSLDQSLGNSLHICYGDPVIAIRELMSRYEAQGVYVTEDFAPYGVERDHRIERAKIELKKIGSSYAITPGRVRKSDGTSYRVFTPFYKAWGAHGWRTPVSAPSEIPVVEPSREFREFPGWKVPRGATMQGAGELAAQNRWDLFRSEGLNEYHYARDFPALDRTSRLSPHLRWGEIHPRTLLVSLGSNDGDSNFRKEIAWREFYADVLFHHPNTSREYYSPKFAKMRYDAPELKFQLWCNGKTGYPFVDAAMRQLQSEGWMHNRLRMVVASFLVKDLHIEWMHGANFFMKYLIDNDVASNSHGWQWTAGCGTDASPYYRIFNPIEQGKRFDSEGEYIKRYIPELRHLSNKDIHEPWLSKDGYSKGYPERIVDHGFERLESLARLKEISN